MERQANNIPERNKILSNSIFSNGHRGINSLAAEFRPSPRWRPTVQLPEDGKPGGTRIPWLQPTHGSRGKAFTLQFFSNTQCDDFLEGQGAELIGTVEFTSDPRQSSHRGVAVFPFAVSPDDGITATATSEDKNTSDFSECSPVEEDSDGDGISDLREDRGPNNGDADNNGIPDKDEPNVATTEANGNEISLETTAQAMAVAIFLAAAEGTDEDVVFSAGLLDLLLEGLEEENPTALGLSPLAEATTVTLTLQPGLQVDSYYNFGPTPDNPDPHFYEFLFDGTTGAEIFADRIVLHFVDGQRGDHDLTENGEIVTRGGPATNATPLYFPFSEIAPGTFTGFAVSNFSNRNAVVEFDAFDSGGELSLFANNPAIFGISESNQLAQLGSEIFDSTSESVSWVKLKTDNPEIASFFQFGKLDLSQLDGSVAISRTSKEFYFTRVFEGAAAYRDQPATTFLSIANPGTEEIELELTLHPSADGISPAGGAPITRTLPAKGFLYESVEDLFGPGVEVSGGWVEGKVTRGGGVVGFELIQLKNQSTVIGLNAVAETGGSESFSAQLATQPGVLFTNVNLINTSDEPRSLTLTAFAEDGTQLAQPAFRMLNPGGQLSEDAASLFVSQPGTGLQGTATDFVGSLQVQADGPGVIGDGIFGDPSRFQFAAALPLQTKSFLEAVFSQVANIPGFFTGLAFFAPEEDANITIEVRAADGTLVGQSQQFLAAGHRLSKLVPELVPDSDGQVGGYIVIRSTAPLIAQQLFGALGADGIRLLSAVPPTVVVEPDLLSAVPSTVVQ